MTFLQTSTLITASLLLMACWAHADTLPTFETYPSKVYTGKRQAVQLNANTRSFRTRFKELQKEPINFAGHYVIGHTGCGGGCLMSMLYNVKTGQTQFLPAVTDCAPTKTRSKWRDKDIFYQENSRLLVLIGEQDESNKQGCQQQFFVEQNGQLKLIRSVAVD